MCECVNEKGSHLAQIVQLIDIPLVKLANNTP